MSSERRFSLDLTDRFVIKVWDDEAVAYDSLSGDTHLLDPLSATIIGLVAQSACSSEEIIHHLTVAYDMPADAHSLDYLHATLSRLKAIGLLVVKND